MCIRDSSKALAESFKKKAKELNGEIVAESSYVSVTDDWALSLIHISEPTRPY